MIVLFLLVLKVVSWHFNASLLNQSLIGFQINPIYYNSQQYLTIFGGVNTISNVYSNSLYIFNYTDITNFSKYTTGPSERAFSCSGVINDTLYYYGGYNGTFYFNDLWSFSLANLTWKQVIVDIESLGRIQCGMVNKSDTLIIFGGKKQSGNSTNQHYQINLTDNTATNISFNSYYTTLSNTLWDGTVENYTTEGIFTNYTNFIQAKNIWLSKISESQSSSLISIVEANETNSVIYILDSDNLLLKETMYLEIGIDSCQILDIGLFCSEYLSTTETPVSFIFFRIQDWRKSKLTSQYIQYSEWPIGIDQSILFDINDDLMAAVTTSTSVNLYRLPSNQCQTNQNTLSCFYNKAYCADNYEGAYCNRQVCPGSLFFNQPYSFENFTFECGGNGKCIDGKCSCDQSYQGMWCSNYVRSQCEGTTDVNYPLSFCTCQDNIKGGNDCMTYFCYNDCSNIGTCNQGVCQCSLPYSGPDCSVVAIDIDFSFERIQTVLSFAIMIFFIF